MLKRSTILQQIEICLLHFWSFTESWKYETRIFRLHPEYFDTLRTLGMKLRYIAWSHTNEIDMRQKVQELNIENKDVRSSAEKRFLQDMEDIENGRLVRNGSTLNRGRYVSSQHTPSRRTSVNPPKSKWLREWRGRHPCYGSILFFDWSGSTVYIYMHDRHHQNG